MACVYIKAYLISSSILLLMKCVIGDAVLPLNIVPGIVNRSDFPTRFAFGVSTSSYQTEGAAKLYGKGPSVWDYYIQQYPGKIKGQANIDVACDSYHRYKEDIALLKYMGITSYRFSIAWTRILPQGSLEGGINQQGIDHYNNVLHELQINSIEPYVTLLHQDSPQVLQDKYGGFLNKSIVNDFRDYCDICFRNFGDKVKHWITINEPTITAQNGYGDGTAPPARCSPSKGCKEGDSGKEPYIVAHNIILAHAAAAQLYRQEYKAKQGGEIGMTLVGTWYLPFSDLPKDVAALDRIKDFNIGWFLDPFVRGNYPQIMRNLVKDRLPTFDVSEKNMVLGSLDFIGINYYTSKFVKGLPLIIQEPYSWDKDSCAQFSQGEYEYQLHFLSQIYPFSINEVILNVLMLHISYCHRKCDR
ncbi:hypothetical protein AQUCO_01100258v1 [Aquilegia coerulea]|uniref:Beta-glucosidase n=1 Tax=Aquilegia coerulea TaxID=218851 RepID=A0A2G5E695_AQUCA|nr:hypothetical protein AQUCO_01100258v1 [Aquilegia coerulea]